MAYSRPEALRRGQRDSLRTLQRGLADRCWGLQRAALRPVLQRRRTCQVDSDTDFGRSCLCWAEKPCWRDVYRNRNRHRPTERRTLLSFLQPRVRFPCPLARAGQEAVGEAECGLRSLGPSTLSAHSGLTLRGNLRRTVTLLQSFMPGFLLACDDMFLSSSFMHIPSHIMHFLAALPNVQDPLVISNQLGCSRLQGHSPLMFLCLPSDQVFHVCHN